MPPKNTDKSRRAASAKKSGGKKPNIKKVAAYAAAAVVLIYFVYTMIWQQVQISRKSKEIDNLRQQVEAELEESDKLRSEIENLNDPEYIERIAREKLGLVRPNERVFVDSNKSGDNGGS